MSEQVTVCEINGIVTGSHGTPLGGARVVIWWQHIRDREELVAGQTDDAGRYSLRFQMPNGVTPPLFVIVEALSEYLDAPLFSPPTQVQAALEIDLNLEQPDNSEWATLNHAIKPSLGSLKLNDLVEDSTHQDLTFLARQSGKSTEALMRLAMSSRLETMFSFPAAAFYAFLRQQVPAALPNPLLDASQSFTLIAPLMQNIASMIFGLSADVQTQTLTAAIAQGLIGTQFTNQVPQLVRQLQALRATDVLNQPFMFRNATLAQLLDVAGLPSAKHLVFAQELTGNSGSMSSFWKTLGDGAHGFAAAEVESIETTLAVGSIVKNFIPLVQRLMQGFAAGTYKTLHDLARLSNQDWIDLVNRTGPPPGVDPAGNATAAEFFASEVYARITRAYPTAALSSAIASSTFVPAAQQRPLMQFFQNHPTINLVSENVPSFIAKQGEAAFTGIAAEDQTTVVSNVRRLQRVLRVSSDPDVAQKLLGLGIKSATEIARMGKQQFAFKASAAGISGTQATQAFHTSALRYANVVSLYMKHNRDSIGVWPQAIGQVSDLDAAVQQAVQRDPSLATLFGSQDYCITDDCTSILSPAAYLCDLLLWLKNHAQASGTALDVLDSRRPDIRNLLLNCSNSDTELPYIDLVNELLADKISPPIDTVATSFVQTALANNTAYYYAVTAMDQAGEGSPSVQVAAIPSALDVAPATPASVSVTQGATQQLSISWGLVAGAIYYKIYWALAADVPVGQCSVIATVSNPYLQTGLTNGTTYFYKVSAVNLYGESPVAVEVSAEVSAAPSSGTIIETPQVQVPPQPPSTVTAVPGNGQVTVQWSAVTGATSYNIYWDTTPGVSRQSKNAVIGAWNPKWKQTPVDATTAELSAAPKYFNQGAFTVLFGASYPFTLPYSAGLDELRSYTQQLKLPLWQIRQALLPLNSAPLAQRSAVAAERFQITSHGEDLITNPNFVPATVAWNTANPPTDLVSIPAFLQGSSLSYESLLEFLQVVWVQGGLNVSIQGIDDTCMTSNQTLSTSSLDAGFLDRGHRFLRLWLATGYKMWELDLLLSSPSVGNGTLDQNALANLLTFRKLQDATGLPVNQLLAFYQDIDIATHRDPDGSTTISLYSQIFLNAAVVSVAPDRDLAAIPIAGSIVSPTLSAHMVEIQAALGVSGADAALLFSLTDNTLTLDNLSFIYRVNALAVPSKFSITSLLSIAGLLDITATNPSAALTPLLQSPAATLSFLSQATAIQQSRLSIDALTYLLSPPSAAIAAGWMTTTQITQANIAATLLTVQQAVAALPVGGDLNGNVIAAVAANAHNASSSGLSNAVGAVILTNLTIPNSTQTLVAVLTDPSFTSSAEPITATNFPNQFVAIQLFDKVAVLVRALGLQVTDLTWLVTKSNVYGGLSFTQLPVLTSGQPALSLSTLLSTLLMIKLARSWTSAPPSSPIQNLYNVIGGVQSGTLANAAAAQSALVTITGWPVGDIAAFSTALNLVFPTDYLTPTTYDALRTLEVMAVTATATGPQIVYWGAAPSDEPTAEAIANSALGVLRAQQSGSDAWLALAPTLMNPIRENRSAALQAYLIAQRDSTGNLVYGDVDGLFDYFLIDVQMSSCQLTSRVVQAYIAVQTFVERCLMNLEAPAIVVDLNADDTWSQWEWMSRYRIWEANREVFLYPENWLIESERPNLTEIYQTFEQEVRQGQSTTDYLETVVLNYIDRLDGIAHLLVTGTCQDPVTNITYVVGRTLEDPPVYYYRSYDGNAWAGWTKIPFTINAHQVAPSIFRGRLCLFWLDVKVSNEPQQQLPVAATASAPPSQYVERYVSMAVNFSIFRNGNWTPPQTSKTKMFDKPVLYSTKSNDAKVVEAMYSMKITNTGTTALGYGSSLSVDVFRLGVYSVTSELGLPVVTNFLPNQAVHLGRAVFDGRFSDVELSSLTVLAANAAWSLLYYAQITYGIDAQSLLALSSIDPNLVGDSGLIPQSGALVGLPGATGALNFTASTPPVQLLGSIPTPVRIVLADTDLNFDPTSYFFYQDNRRSYWVEAQPYSITVTSSMGQTQLPSAPVGTYYFTGYNFHPFYHAFTHLFWHQLSSGGFDLLYDPNLQQAPDSIDPTYPDIFNFRSTYQPSATQYMWWDLSDVSTILVSPISSTTQTQIVVTNNIYVPSPAIGFFVTIESEILKVTAVSGPNNTTWTVLRGQQNTAAGTASAGAVVTPTDATQDRQFLDFSTAGSYSVYNWELFYHVPLYIAQLLSQNLQFEDAQGWFHYIFNPSRQSSDPSPQRFWIPKPLHDLTSYDILTQQINDLLLDVNEGNPTDVKQIELWRSDPFNPFLLADQRPVAYMKSAVMSYLDNLIAWGDNLFSTESREALGEATLLYVLASEVLGPAPVGVTPPPHADQSFDQLAPSLDAFANAMVEIENVIGDVGTGSTGTSGGAGIPGPETFYFKIPSNAKLLGYWTTVADRLYKLRHCQNIAGAPLQLALFDAPIDPGLLIAAQAAGVDLTSVLSDFTASLPNYRFTFLYPQALDFVNAVRAYGASLQSALEKNDSGALALLQQTTAQQLLIDGNDILDLAVQKAQQDFNALQETYNLAQQKIDFFTDQLADLGLNAWEITELSIFAAEIVNYLYAAGYELLAGSAALLPDFLFGATGFGGTPTSNAKDGGSNVSHAGENAANAGKSVAAALDKTAMLAMRMGTYSRRSETWTESLNEAEIQKTQANYQIASAQLSFQIAQRNQTIHQEQIDNIQKQIDFLNTKFTNDSLYDWMAASLSTTYFQSYQLAYQLCKQLEHCYQFELGIFDSSFIQFGYWDSLHKGLLAGETLNHDLRRMQASYLQRNARRYELSRFVSLGQLNPLALQQLLVTGVCDFDFTESLFDNDYPGHYNRRLTRVSVTVVYPSPGKFDNVKATLTLVANRVRVSTDTSSGYAENPSGSDSRFVYSYAAVPQKVALGNAQDDPGLFITAIASNIVDQRYLPFENAGAISSWHFEMPQINNEVDLSTVGDVVLHLYYTALDGGQGLQQAVQEYNTGNLPTSGIKLFSAQNDFVAALPTVDVPYPLTPWQAFTSAEKTILGATPVQQQDGSPGWQAFIPPAEQAANVDQTLVLSISPLKFPTWTRGKTITVTSVTVLVVAWEQGTFMLAPLAPLPTSLLPMLPVVSASEPNICAAMINMPANTPLGTWSFKIRLASAADFQSLNKNLIGDVLLLVNYDVN